ncbi:perilipin-2-like [Pristis pectinata]|uniref:perilipin-2-like n=1 Tax=Pristis pectinata TaxID=685728 RepID=UPI00223E5E53|nr:perilipin-2-like [Pristis pectinata]XP_051876046.1 perilipin-2-like [Pristis pectinata]
MSQNVVVRVAHLPLFNTAYNMVTSVYNSTKVNHPYLRSLCEATEKGVMAITAVAVTSAMPIFQKLEPQITFANDYACKGLDKMEKKLPFLHHSSNQIIANAKDVVSTKVSGAREIFANTVSGVVDKTKETVHESVEMTMAIVNSSLNHVLELHVVKMLNSRVNSALASSEMLVDRYLPLTENEQATEAKRIDGFEGLAPSYYRRLESLSTKVWQQAYEQATIAILNAKQQSQEVLSQLRYNLDLIEYVRRNISTTNRMINDAWDKLYQKLVEWKTSNLECEGCESDVAENPSQQMQTGRVMLVSCVWGLPQNIQDQVQCITVSAMEMYMMSRTSFKELPNQIFSTNKDQLTKTKNLLDGLVDYLVNNTPLNWLVGPFYPQLTGSQHPDQEVKTDITEEQQLEQMHSCGD